MKTIELKVDQLDVVVCEVNNDVIAYVKPYNGLHEEELRAAALTKTEIDNATRKQFIRLGLNVNDAKRTTGANASGYFAILIWENTVITEQTAPTKPNVIKRGWNWLTTRDVEWHKGYLTGTAVTAVAAIIIIVADRR